MAISKYEHNDAVITMPTKSSGSGSWIQWHKTMKKYMGRKQANIVWLKAWHMRAGKDSPASNSSLREYAQSQGIKIEKTAGQVFSDEVVGGLITAVKATSIVSLAGIGLILLGIAVSVSGITRRK